MKSTRNWNNLHALINQQRTTFFTENRFGTEEFQKVTPSQTDETINHWNEPHIVARPTRKPPSGYLVLFLAGSYGQPRRQLSLMQAIADLGHYVINLRYPNDWTIGGLYRSQPSADCHEKIRRQILTGQPMTDLIDLPPQHSIDNRFTKLLAWLSTRDPQHDWGQFLDGSDQPKWSNIMVSGHSQGGGHALLISKIHRVARCVLFSAPTDVLKPVLKPSPWIARAGATPLEGCYGFCHVKDRIFEQAHSGWEAMGLDRLGPLIKVDNTPPPYENSHMLCSEAHIVGANHHGCVATDRATPRLADGSPAFQDVWNYLFALEMPSKTDGSR